MNLLRSVKVRVYLRVLGELNMQAYANHVHLYCMSPTAVEYTEFRFYILLLYNTSVGSQRYYPSKYQRDVFVLEK